MIAIIASAPAIFPLSDPFLLIVGIVGGGLVAGYNTPLDASHLSDVQGDRLHAVGGAARTSSRHRALTPSSPNLLSGPEGQSGRAS